MKNEANRSQFKSISENSNEEKKFSSKSSLNPAQDSGSIQIALSNEQSLSSFVGVDGDVRCLAAIRALHTFSIE